MHFSKTIGLAFAAATIAGSAFAADLPSRRVAPAYVAPAPIMTWAGFYVGLNAGYNWSNSSVNYNGVPNFTGGFFHAFGQASNAVGAVKSNGFIGGGQVGWNWQSGAFVAGIETDIQGLFNSGSLSSVVSIFPDPFVASNMITTTSSSRKVDWLGTVRGRVGFAVTPSFLLYATGGLAYGGAKLNSTWVQLRPAVAGNLGNIAATSASGTRVGWTVGAGGEWMFARNWSAKLEYMYYDLGSLTTNSSPLLSLTSGNWLAFTNSRAKINGHIVRAGLNYHFNWGAGPIVAKY